MYTSSKALSVGMLTVLNLHRTCVIGIVRLVELVQDIKAENASQDATCKSKVGLEVISTAASRRYLCYFGFPICSPFTDTIEQMMRSKLRSGRLLNHVSGWFVPAFPPYSHSFNLSKFPSSA